MPHSEVPEGYRPLIFSNGQQAKPLYVERRSRCAKMCAQTKLGSLPQVEFPKPTRSLRPPYRKHS